jgi:hypothetical protein
MVNMLFMAGASKGNSTNYTPVTPAITAYGGTQPTAAAFLANWDATYKNAQLVHWINCTQTHPNGDSLTLGLTMWVTPLPAPQSASNEGTAAWAVIWQTNVTLASLASSTIPNTAFCIIPVTDTAGTGILRMANTSILAGASTAMDSCGIEINSIA